MYAGDNCEISPPSASSSEAQDSTTTTVFGSIVALIIIVFLALKLVRRHNVWRAIRRLTKLANGEGATDEEELNQAMFDAFQLQQDALVPKLLGRGASAAARHPKTHFLPHAIALTRPEPDGELLLQLFRLHFSIDNQIGTLIQDPERLVVMEAVLANLTTDGWRSKSTSGTTLHRVVDSCRRGAIDPGRAVSLSECILDVDHELLTMTDAANKTPGDYAMAIEDAVALERLLTVVVHGNYQLTKPNEQIYRSPTAVVMECRDLSKFDETEAPRRRGSAYDSAGVENGSNPTTVSSTTTPLVIKMMTDYASWRREIESREILASAQSSIIPVDSVASASKETPDQIGGLTVLRRGSISVERELQGLATKLMLQYPYALCMERAEKNLLECISNDRLATEPLVIIRSIVSKIGSCMSALHKLGVVHGDCKPRNICRLADNSFRLIDFDMAFAPALAATAKGLPNVHATAGKIEGTNAYVAPELFRWSRESASTAPGSEQALKLEDAIKLDIWSFGCTVYESVSGISLAQHIYDVATDQGEERLLKWTGLHKAEDAQLRKLHEGQDTTGLLDLLHWMLAPDPAERPGSMEVVLEHAFFQPGKGSMREHFVVDRIKQLLPVTDEDRASRKYGNVMISYCWANTTFVLDRLCLALAPLCRVCGSTDSVAIKAWASGRGTP